MKLTIEVDLDNACFEDDTVTSVRWVLGQVCDRMPYPLCATKAKINLYDPNGNHVGFAEIAEGAGVA
jgi:hypothetical protein